jgi:hypothetical protein
MLNIVSCWTGLVATQPLYIHRTRSGQVPADYRVHQETEGVGRYVGKGPCEDRPTAAAATTCAAGGRDAPCGHAPREPGKSTFA